MSPRTTHTLRLAGAALAVGTAMAMVGCRGDRSDKPPRQFFPDMDNQPRWKPQSESGFYADGRTMRRPVEGTVPFGVSYVVSDTEAGWAEHLREKRGEFLAEDYARFDGTDEMGEVLDRIPDSIEVDLNLMALGQKKFNIFCATCHGVNGEGADSVREPGRGSMVGRRWSIPIPSFHDPLYLPGGERGQDGYLFFVARHGVNTMPSYAHAIDTREAWAIVAYIRALQASHLGTPEDVPADILDSLGEPPAPPAPEATEPEPSAQGTETDQ